MILARVVAESDRVLSDRKEGGSLLGRERCEGGKRRREKAEKEDRRRFTVVE